MKFNDDDDDDDDDDNNNNNNRIQRRNLRIFNLLTTLRTVSTRTLKWPGRNLVQIERLSRATWYEATAQLLSLTEFNSHLLLLYFIG